MDKHELKLNYDWNNLVKEISLSDSHSKTIDLIRQKSNMWESNIRSGFKLTEYDVWMFNEQPQFIPHDITSWSSATREYKMMPTNCFPQSWKDPILEIPKPKWKPDTQMMVGDIVHVRFTNGKFRKAKVIEIKEPKIIECDEGKIEFPPSVLSKDVETGSDYRGYIVDYEYCPDDEEYYEKKYEDKWERRFPEDENEYYDWW